MTEQPSPGDAGRPPTEEELRAAYEAELQRIRVEDIVVQTIVSLLNLGGRRAGLAPGTEDERDLEQLQMAIDGARALLPLVEDQLGPDAATLREALSQLQMAYAQLRAGAGPARQPGDGAEAGAGDEGESQAPPAPGAPGEQEPKPGEAGPAERSGRLWIPGQ
ncbi:MAG: hypothetical protein QOH46_140 [Solirubrobacteraceae bacterium]|jgi:hypothetical protein|nr:hypothetical protein [Solirubrobacteraceae bacterium]